MPIPDGLDPDPTPELDDTRPGGGADDDESDDDAADPTADEIAAQIIDLESQQRLWLKTCLAFVTMARGEDESPAIALAKDLVTQAAAARAKRILRGDLPATKR